MSGSNSKQISHEPGKRLKIDGASLARQFNLAGRICDQAENASAVGPDMKATRETVRALKQQECVSAEEVVRWKGVSVDWLLDCFFKLPALRRLEQLDPGLWFVREVFVLELLRRKGIQSGALIDHVDVFAGQSDVEQLVVRDEATTFLSYTGRYCLSNFLELLEKLRGEYIWMDVFCVNQFAWTLQKGTPSMKESRQKLIEGLQSNIKSIKRTVLLLEKWHDTLYTLRQMWVLWEVFNTVESGSKLEILLTEHERTCFVGRLMSGNVDHNCVTDFLMGVDFDDLVATDMDDRAEIVKVLREKELHKVSCKITGVLREWLRSIAVAHAKCLTNSTSTLADDEIAGIGQIASMLAEQGKYKDAETLFEQVLSHFRKLGDEHPNTLCTMNNLANLHMKRGKFDLAQQWLEEVLSVRRRNLEDEHPEMLSSINNLALVYRRQGRHEESRALFEEALSAQRRILGNKHPNTLSSISNLANLYVDQGDHDKAEVMLEEVMLARLRIGGEYPDTLSAVDDMADFYMKQERFDKAEPLFTRVLSIRLRVLGSEHPDTLDSINFLGNVHYCQQDYDNAEPFYEEALLVRRRTVGDGHPHTLGSVYNLALLRVGQGKYDEARLLLQEAVAGYRHVLGEGHPRFKSAQELLDSLDKQSKSCRTELNLVFGDVQSTESGMDSQSESSTSESALLALVEELNNMDGVSASLKFE